DVEVEYANVAPHDVLMRITATNRGPEAAPLHVLPTLWFRNTWAWGRDDRRPELRAVPREDAARTGTKARGGRLVQARHFELGDYWLVCQGDPELLFTGNESHAPPAWGPPHRPPHVHDGLDASGISGDRRGRAP